ncbi:MAG: winged helix-turn-helix domain-containing protein [Acidobacteria bacterium]|nr:winged helix-turn-helix domain-containing protein [Acidobacteriota bacterium]
MNNKMYDFGGFRLDEDQKCLWRDEELVSLTPKAIETLLVLVRNNGKVITKDALLDEVWANTFVEEATLAQNISTLRKTLAKYDENIEFITTIPRRGYRFVEDVTEISAEEEEVILEKHSVTHIVAEQRQIHDSQDDLENLRRSRPNSGRSAGSFLSTRIVAMISLAVICAGAIAYAAYFYISKGNDFYHAKFQKFRVGTLMSGANLQGGLVSGDGKYVAIVDRKNEGDAILLRQIEDGNMLEVLPKSNLLISGLTFSPDNSAIFYSAYQKEPSVQAKIAKLYRIPILGGAPREIITDIDSPVAITADNKKLAFVRNQLNEKKSALMIADIDGKNEKVLAIRPLLAGFSTFGLSWSPDGKLISTVIIEPNSEGPPARVGIINAETGEAKTLSEHSWMWVGRTIWLNDGSGIAAVAYGSSSPNLTDEVWFVSYPEGKARIVTNGLKGINGISLTDDLESIIATRVNRITTFYVSPFDDLDSPREIAKNVDGEAMLALGSEWSGNEKIVFGKIQNGNSDLWMMDADGKNEKQITSDKSADYAPRITNDGKHIFFLSNRSGNMNVWRVDSNGENPTRITTNGNVGAHSVSSVNGNIYYIAKAKDKAYAVLWVVDPNGAGARQITFKRTYGAKVSPDGKYIFCFYPDDKTDAEDFNNALKFTVLAADSGKVVKQFASLTSRNFPAVEWSHDSGSFLYLETDENTALWRQTIDDQAPAKLKEWTNGKIYQFALSKDGSKLFFEKGEEVNSIIQLQNVKAE